MVVSPVHLKKQKFTTSKYSQRCIVMNEITDQMLKTKITKLKNKKVKARRCVHACSHLLIHCAVCEKLDEPTLALIRESNSCEINVDSY